MTRSRAALKLAPSFLTIEDGKDAYISHPQLRGLAKQHGRFWSFYSIPTTVALPNNRFAKSLKGFPDHMDDETRFRELLREYGDNGVPRPSGYADVFHEKFSSPRVNYSVNALLAPCFAGGWQQALKIGRHPGVYYKYDMRSAYLWAATFGLPDTRTYTRSLRPSSKPGLYRVHLLEGAEGAPFPFNRGDVECLATSEEIETYGLRIGRIIDGVTWSRMTNPTKMLDAIYSVSTWKQAGRSFWGRWAQRERIECYAHGKKWVIPNLALNVPWAHLIVSRVRNKLWQASGNAVHVFVDSVITPDVIPTGDKVGDWRLEKVYKNGVIVRKPGQYGAADEAYLDRMAGIAKDSPLRRISA
jgi:hypothetical protein